MSVEPIVFLPGFMCDSRLFRAQAESLSATRPVHVAPLGPFDSVREMAGRVLDHAPPLFALCGASLGGMVAMEIARRAPERITRMILIATDALTEQPSNAAARELLIARARAGRFDDAWAEALPAEALAPGAARARVQDISLAMARGFGTEGFQSQARALQRRPDQQGTLRRIQLPTLMICGQHDRLFPPRRHQLMADLMPMGEALMLEEAGHLPTLEQPDEVTRVIDLWLTA